MKPRHRLASLAVELRNNATDVERLLWQHLRNSQVEGVKFRRQQAIGDYVVDFVSFSPKLVIELDGGQHALNRESDRCRDECLRKNGFAVLRFWNNEVIENIGGVLEVIRRQCLEGVARARESPACKLHTRKSPTPTPPPARGGNVSAHVEPGVFMPNNPDLAPARGGGVSAASPTGAPSLGGRGRGGGGNLP